MSTGESDRPRLTRERIVGAAIELADAEGIGKLSMRRLAAALGFEVMSLYNHVASKDDLVEAMVDEVLGEVPDPPADADWRTGVRHLATATHDALLAEGGLYSQLYHQEFSD